MLGARMITAWGQELETPATITSLVHNCNPLLKRKYCQKPCITAVRSVLMTTELDRHDESQWVLKLSKMDPGEWAGLTCLRLTENEPSCRGGPVPDVWIVLTRGGSLVPIPSSALKLGTRPLLQVWIQSLTSGETYPGQV